jgi:hypothetical protein
MITIGHADSARLRAKTPGTDPAPGTPGSAAAKPAAVPHPRHAHPDRIRTSGQPDPARRVTRIRQPGSGKPRAHQSGKPGDAQPLAADAGQSGSYLDDLAPAASEPPLTRLMWCKEDEAAALIFLSSCLPAAGRRRGFSSMSRLVVLHIRTGCPCREPARPARRRAGLGASPGPPADSAHRARWPVPARPYRSPGAARRRPARPRGRCPPGAGSRPGPAAWRRPFALSLAGSLAEATCQGSRLLGCLRRQVTAERSRRRRGGPGSRPRSAPGWWVLAAGDAPGSGSGCGGRPVA